jgi:hypothetical protein
MWRQWLARSLQSSTRKLSSKRPEPRRRLRPRLEILEDRLAPAVTLSFPPNLTAFAGSIVAVPVNVNRLNDIGVGGLSAASFAISYDPNALSVANTDVFLGTVPANCPGPLTATPLPNYSGQLLGWNITVNVNQPTGQLGITINSNGALNNIPKTVGGDSLVDIDFHVLNAGLASTTP